MLILDEATSALDNHTEKLIIQSLNNLSKDLTTIFIAHRLSTLQNLDIIFKIENGQVIEKGSFEEIIGKTLQSN